MNNISDKLTEQKLKEILLVIVKKGQLNQNIKVIDLLEEIKQNVMLLINSSDQNE